MTYQPTSYDVRRYCEERMGSDGFISLVNSVLRGATAGARSEHYSAFEVVTSQIDGLDMPVPFKVAFAQQVLNMHIDGILEIA